MKPNYKINMVMNNNVVLATNLNNNIESVLLGKGIGFGKKKNSKVYFSNEIIEKSFVNFSESEKSEYYQLIQQMDITTIGLCEEIIHMAETELGELNDSIHIVLTDHIGFAIERMKQKMEISNPFLFEIKHLYEDEFKLAIKAVEMINSEHNIKLPEDEAGFIALHLHSAIKNTKVRKTLKNTRIIKEVVELIEREVEYSIGNTGLTYRRLLTHIRASIDRIENKLEIENPLLLTIKVEFKKSWEVSLKVRDIIESGLDLKMCDEEIGYLTIHIDRLRRLKEQKK